MRGCEVTLCPSVSVLSLFWAHLNLMPRELTSPRNLLTSRVNSEQLLSCAMGSNNLNNYGLLKIATKTAEL